MNTNLTNTLINILKFIDNTNMKNSSEDSKKNIISLSDYDFATAALFISHLNRIVQKLPIGVQDFNILDIEFKQLDPNINLDKIIVTICNVKGFNTMSDIENFLVSKCPFDINKVYCIIVEQYAHLVIYHQDYMKYLSDAHQKALLYNVVTEYHNIKNQNWNEPICFHSSNSSNKPLLIIKYYTLKLDQFKDLLFVEPTFYFNQKYIKHIDEHFILFNDGMDGTIININHTIYQNASNIIEHVRNLKLKELCDE